MPVVYVVNVFAKLLQAFETLAVVASESMQPQTMTEFVRTFALMFERWPIDQHQRADDLIRRSLSALGEHVLTAELSEALSDLVSRSTRRGGAIPLPKSTPPKRRWALPSANSVRARPASAGG